MIWIDYFPLARKCLSMGEWLSMSGVEDPFDYQFEVYWLVKI